MTPSGRRSSSGSPLTLLWHREGVRFHWLNFHLPYACRDSGMCCTAGWPIPVEQARRPLIQDAVQRHVIPLRAQPWLTPSADAPEEFAGTLTLRDNGHCVFFEAGRSGCSIHDVKPAACVHFPYVCLIDQRGVHVTLSHYCPTAASLLFEYAGAMALVQGPSPVPDGHALEGLDARESLPPAAEGALPRLLSFEEFSAWERDAVAGACIDGLQPNDRSLFDRARAAVPPPWTWPAARADFEEAWAALVEPAWPRFEDPLRRYAAAKVFASWAAYQGDGLPAIRRVAAIAGAVLRVECARRCAQDQQPLDRYLLTQAIGQTDLLLVHYADPQRLAGSERA